MMIYHASLAVLWLVLGYWPAGTSFSRKWRNSIGIPRGESCRARQGKKTMAEATAVVDRKSISSFKKWFLEGQVKEVEGPHEKEGQHHTHSWWQVMCLTGVDYFSTLGYQPSIAFVAAAALSPLATLIVVLLTLLGALPIYSRVARESPHGEGSISMLEDLLPRWRGKLFVLILLGFVATDFIITITLSAADATAHIVDNPFAPPFLHDHRVAVTLLLVSVLGGGFLNDFKEAIGLAVLLVASYLLLNLVIVGVGMYEILIHPQTLSAWKNAMFSMPEVKGNQLLMIGLSLILFPKLALGLSGFDTGVAVMPLVKGDPGDDPKRPAGRIRNTRRLLLSAALIMSFMLISSSLVTTMLIPAEEFRPATATQKGGEADGRDEAAGAGLHGHRFRRDDHLRRGSQRARRRLRHRRAGADDFGRGGGDHVNLARWGGQIRLSRDLAGLRLHPGHQHHRAARRHQDRVVLHHLDHRGLVHFARAALDRVAGREGGDERGCAGLHRGGREGDDPDHRQPPRPGRRGRVPAQGERGALEQPHPGGRPRAVFRGEAGRRLGILGRSQSARGAGGRL